MKTIMITGASGMIGMEVASSLLAKGHKIIGVDRQSNELMTKDNYMFVQSSITDKSKITSIVNNSALDAVIHLANSCDNDIPSTVTDLEVDNNKACDKYLWKACASAGVKDILMLSTTQVYALTKTREPIRETFDVKPSSNYAKMKFDSENALLAAVKKTDCTPVIMRIPQIYTLNYTQNMRDKIYDPKDDVGFVIGDGAYGFSFCCLYNLVDFINAIIAGPHGHYDGVFNVCDTKTTLAKDIVDNERKNHRVGVVLQRNATALAVKSAISLSKKAKVDYRYVDMSAITNNTCFDNTKAKRFSPFRWTLANTK